MKSIDRSKYYKKDYEGFMIYSISKLYSDLQINTMLIKSLKDEDKLLSDEAEIYLFKILISHLKEGLKLLSVMKKISKYKKIFDNWVNNNETIKKIMDKISDEFENPKNFPNTVNARFLNIRHEVFHYNINKEQNYQLYIDSQKKMIENNLNVNIKIDNKGKYLYEEGLDLTLMNYDLNPEAMQEIFLLKNRILIILREILTDYYNKF